MTTDTHFGQREPATSAAEVSAPLSGLTPAQRAALAQMLIGPAQKYRGTWRAGGDKLIAAVTINILQARGLARVSRAGGRNGRAVLTDLGRWYARAAASTLCEAS